MVLNSSRLERDSSRLGILHVVAPAAIGGLERVVYQLASGHAKAGHRVAVAAVLTDRDDPTWLSDFSDAGVILHRIRPGHRRYFREKALVASICADFAPDVVHTHGYRPDVVDAAAAGRFGVPTVTTVHGFTGGGVKNRFFELLQRQAFRCFDGVVATSAPLADRLLRSGVSSSVLHTVPNAYSGEALLTSEEARGLIGVDPDVFHIGWVGRLSGEKGGDVFIDALALVTDLPYVASIIGDGRERNALMRRARSLGIASRLHWLGNVETAARLFPGFSMFVLSSRTEGTPIVLFEAMHAGVPVAATRVGGVPDVVSSSEAWLVEPESPAALAAAIRTVHGDPHAAARGAAAARRRLRVEFAIEPWLRKYEAIYASVLARRAEHGGKRR